MIKVYERPVDDGALGRKTTLRRLDLHIFGHHDCCLFTSSNDTHPNTAIKEGPCDCNFFRLPISTGTPLFSTSACIPGINKNLLILSGCFGYSTDDELVDATTIKGQKEIYNHTYYSKVGLLILEIKYILATAYLLYFKVNPCILVTAYFLTFTCTHLQFLLSLFTV